jgi:hypothetical protein
MGHHHILGWGCPFRKGGEEEEEEVEEEEEEGGDI